LTFSNYKKMKINKFIYALICFALISCNGTDNSLDKNITNYIEKHSGEELSNDQYYFLLNTNSCHACNDVIVKFLNQYTSEQPIKLILKGNSKREIEFNLPINKNSNLIVYYDLTNSKTNLKMPILINPMAQELTINEITIYNYKKILSKIK